MCVCEKERERRRENVCEEDVKSASFTLWMSERLKMTFAALSFASLSPPWSSLVGLLIFFPFNLQSRQILSTVSENLFCEFWIGPLQKVALLPLLLLGTARLLVFSCL